MRCDSDLQRTFYETEAMLNNWNVKALSRAVDSMLFERTGLSTDKAAVLEKHLEIIRQGGDASYIEDPVAWQREQRQES